MRWLCPVRRQAIDTEFHLMLVLGKQRQSIKARQPFSQITVTMLAGKLPQNLFDSVRFGAGISRLQKKNL